MSVKVLAIDPGHRVGWAHGVIETRKRPVMTSPPMSFAEACKTDVGPLLRGEPTTTYVDEEFEALTVTGHGISFLKDFALKLNEVYANYDVVVYETWRLRAAMARKMAGNDMQTSQLIGMIRLLGWLHPDVKLVGQGPDTKSTAERVAPEDVRKIIDGLPKRHDDAHDGDALLHLAYYHWKNHA